MQQNYQNNYEPEYTGARANPYYANSAVEPNLPLGDGMSVEPGVSTDRWRMEEENLRSRYLESMRQRQKENSFVQTDDNPPQKGNFETVMAVDNAENRQTSDNGSESESGGGNKTSVKFQLKLG